MAAMNDTVSAANARNDALSALIKEVADEKTRDYIANRVIKQMEWYSKKSVAYKRQYNCWMTVSIVLGAAIPVASVFADGTVPMKALIAALGGAVTAVNAYLTLHNSRELWMEYRITREKLLRILYSYSNDIDIFAQKSTQREKDALLISTCEEELSRETGAWRELLKGNSLSVS